jgi:hypothetical protein
MCFVAEYFATPINITIATTRLTAIAKDAEKPRAISPAMRGASEI